MTKKEEEIIRQRLNDLTDIVNLHTESIAQLKKIIDQMDGEIAVIVDHVFEHNAELDS